MGSHPAFDPKLLDVILFLLGLGLLALLIAIRLGKALWSGVFSKSEVPEEAEVEDILDVTLAEGDMCPNCWVHGLKLEAGGVATDGGRTLLKIFNCPHCLARFRSD